VANHQSYKRTSYFLTPTKAEKEAINKEKKEDHAKAILDLVAERHGVESEQYQASHDHLQESFGISIPSSNEGGGSNEPEAEIPIDKQLIALALGIEVSEVDELDASPSELQLIENIGRLVAESRDPRLRALRLIRESAGDPTTNFLYGVFKPERLEELRQEALSELHDLGSKTTQVKSEIFVRVVDAWQEGDDPNIAEATLGFGQNDVQLIWNVFVRQAGTYRVRIDGLAKTDPDTNDIYHIRITANGIEHVLKISAALNFGTSAIDLEPGEYTIQFRDVAMSDAVISLFRVEKDLGKADVVVANHRVESFVPDHWVHLETTNDASITEDSPVWLLVHGRNDSFDREDSSMANLAASFNNHEALEGAVVTLEWSKLSQSLSLKASDWIPVVARIAHRKLTALGIDATQLKLFGHSWGSYVAHDLAAEFGQVNTLVALDPARDLPLLNAFYYVDFDSVAKVSWAFISSALGDTRRAATANHTFRIDSNNTNDITDVVKEHRFAVDIVARMLDIPRKGTTAAETKISNLIDIFDDSLKPAWADKPPWRPGESPNYEGFIRIGRSLITGEIELRSLRYMSGTDDEVLIVID
jgi:pimeloyl-ACP methyl ester carboxylesterase